MRDGGHDRGHERPWAVFDAGLRSVAIVFLHGWRFGAHEPASRARFFSLP